MNIKKLINDCLVKVDYLKKDLKKIKQSAEADEKQNLRGGK